MHSYRYLLIPVLVASAISLAPRAILAQGDLASKLAEIERSVDAKREELHIPGISLAIVRDDKVIYCKGLGVRNVEQNLPVTTKTHFAIGSSSKAFTAMTVMMAAEEGKLAVTDSPKKYLPYFKINDPDIDSKVTIGDLLSHRSGLERTDVAWYTGKLNEREIIQVAGEAKPTAKLGQKFQYQNVMFLAAGQIVAAVEKKPWRKVVAERIFKPLGMKTSSTDVVDMQRRPDFAYGYQWDAEKKAYDALPARQIKMIAPAGAINSNAEEMAQWVRLMTNGGSFGGKRLISEKSYSELVAPHMKMAPKVDYGYGWMLRDWNGHKVVEHGGNIDGFNAQVAFMPDQKLGFVLLTNVSASSLGSYTMSTVWEKLVGGAPKPVEGALSLAVGPQSDPSKEVGKYKLAGAPVAFDISFKEGKLVFTVTGQPPYILMPLGGRRYKLGSPAPDGFFATFRPAKDKPDATEIFVEQPQGNVVAVRDAATFTSPISVEELMKKVAEARGGEANLRKHASATMRYVLAMESQGVTGHGVERWARSGAHSDEVTLVAVGKKIAQMRDCFDGKSGAAEVSFAVSHRKGGKELANAPSEAAFAPELDWRKLYKAVSITRTEKVDGEECYVVEKTVDKGDRYVDYISSKSFLPLKTEGPGGSSETFKDYRDVDGVRIAFERIRTGGLGNLKVTVRDFKFDERLAAAVFRPRFGESTPAGSTPQPMTRESASAWALSRGYD